MLTCCVEQLILPLMEAHPRLCGFQTAAIERLYKLTKGDLVKNIDLSTLKQVVELTLKAMENFPNHFQVSANLNLSS
jgi:Zyg-11 family protein